MPVPVEGETTPVRAAAAARIWTVFGTVGAALIAVVAFQIVAVLGVVAWRLNQGVTAANLAEDLMATMLTPPVFIFLGLASQVAMLATVLLAAHLSPEPFTQRLGLVRPALPPSGYVALAFGSWLPLAIGLGAAMGVAELIKPDESVEKLYEQMSWGWALPFLLFISLAPGFCEEVLFRGYVQRRLLERWSPWAAIAVTSVLFALFHVTPHAIALAFPMGLWLGWIAWRTGSVWPGALCHAFVNGSWNVLSLGTRLAGWPEEPPVAVWVILGAIAVAGFVVSVRLLRRWRPTGVSPDGDIPVAADSADADQH